VPDPDTVKTQDLYILMEFLQIICYPVVEHGGCPVVRGIRSGILASPFCYKR
jgi:hypothetical protein